MKLSPFTALSIGMAAACLLVGLLVGPLASAQDQSADQEAPKELTAAELNARQRIQQTVRVKRFINGEVVEERSVDVSDVDLLPVNPSEAGTTLGAYVRDQVDREVLTRREALAEADIDFTLADTNIDNAMSADEFSRLWHERTDDVNYASTIAANSDGASINGASAMMAKFEFMAGMEMRLDRRAYIAEVLRDFDSMDANGDYILRDAELISFRHVSLGLEANVTQAAEVNDAEGNDAEGNDSDAEDVAAEPDDS